MRKLFVVVSLFLAACGCGAARLTVKMTGNENADMFICGRIDPEKPFELTCLDVDTYAARIKAQLEAKQHRSDM